MRWAIIFAILLVAVVPVYALADITGTASVIDGDTIEIHGQRIRFHGIDAIPPPAAALAPSLWRGLSLRHYRCPGRLGHADICP